jgi:hypothetical protein
MLSVVVHVNDPKRLGVFVGVCACAGLSLTTVQDTFNII